MYLCVLYLPLLQQNISQTMARHMGMGTYVEATGQCTFYDRRAHTSAFVRTPEERWSRNIWGTCLPLCLPLFQAVRVRIHMRLVDQAPR